MENAILNIGDMVAKYRVVRLLSLCDSSVLYEAEDVQLRRTVCIELFSRQFASDELKHRLMMEAHSVARLSHPNICPINDVQDVDGRLLIVRDFFEGKCLSFTMGGKPLGLNLLLSYAIQISSALAAAHGVGIVFRDLNPANILVTPSGVKLLGLGPFIPLVDATAPSRSYSSSPALLVGGSAPADSAQVQYSTYLSPEQARGIPVDARSDLFSFGVVLYEMATGTPAFASSTPDMQPVDLLQRTPPAPRSLDPNLPPALEEIILKAIERDRDRRYQKAPEILVDLERLQTQRRKFRKLDRVGGPGYGSAEEVPADLPWPEAVFGQDKAGRGEAPLQIPEKTPPVDATSFTRIFSRDNKDGGARAPAAGSPAAEPAPTPAEGETPPMIPAHDPSSFTGLFRSLSNDRGAAGTPATKPAPTPAGAPTEISLTGAILREPAHEPSQVETAGAPSEAERALKTEAESSLLDMVLEQGKLAGKSTPQRPTAASTVDAEASSKVLDRTLDLALPLSVPLLTPMEIIALLRLPSSASLYELLLQDRDSGLLNAMRSRGLLLEFLRDSAGRLRPVDVIMKVNAPDFEPPLLQKKIRVRPDRDCEVQTFLLTPKQTGVLSVQFDVLLDDLTVASRVLKTRSHSSDRTAAPANPVVVPVVVSVPLSVKVRRRRPWSWIWAAAAIVLVACAIPFMGHHSKRATISGVQRGSSLQPAPESSPTALSGKNYALLFATDDYDHWPHLNNPRHDAQTIADELRTNYSFSDPQPRVVTNPKTKEIIDILHEYGARTYGQNDQLFIYFAGHGFFDEREKEGFLIGSESKLQKDDSEHSTYLNFSRLAQILDNIPVGHIFVVLDVCYGGAFDTRVTKWAGQRGEADEYADVAPDKFIRRKLAVKGRLYLTSGEVTSVPDGKPGQHSPFARRFIEVLRGYGGHKQLVTATLIAVEVAKLEPEPRFGDFGDSAPGADFLFISK